MIESGNLTMCAAVTLPMAIPGPASLALSYDRAGIERRLTHSGNFCYRVNSSRLIPSTDELAEFDADHLSHSPNNYAPVSEAVSSDQQCKLPGNFDRAAYLQRCSGLGPITNETGNRVPAKFNACCCHLLHPTSQLECEQSRTRPETPRPIGQSARAANQRGMARVNAVHCRAFLMTLSSLVTCCRFCRRRKFEYDRESSFRQALVIRVFLRQASFNKLALQIS
jgi:hypothetical protein